MAEQKFGTGASERLAERLEKLRWKDVTNLEHTKVVGEWLFECESGEELLARVERLCESSPTGDIPPLN